MTDLEIDNYIKFNSYEISSYNCIMDILNTSPQIISEKYDFDKRIMTISTPNNIFKFKIKIKHN